MIIYHTSNYNKTFAACDRAAERKDMVLLHGPGQGKTTAVLHYSKSMSGVLYISLKSSKTLQESCVLILKALDGSRHKLVQFSRLGPDDLLNEIHSSLNEMQMTLSGIRLIVLDDTTFNLDFLCWISEFRERTKSLAGLLIVAGADPQRELKSARLTLGRTRFKRLLNGVVALERPSKDEVRTIATNNGLEDWRSLYLDCKTHSQLFSRFA